MYVVSELYLMIFQLNFRETSEKVPTLDEALSFVKKNKLNVVIDVKDHSEEVGEKQVSILIEAYDDCRW